MFGTQQWIGSGDTEFEWSEVFWTCYTYLLVDLSVIGLKMGRICQFMIWRMKAFISELSRVG